MRLFVAVPLPDECREHLFFLSAGLAEGRRISPENMHLTLCFIGDVEGVDVEDIDAALGAIENGSFQITLADVGIFGHQHMVHTAWVGVEESLELKHLQAKVARALRGAGIQLESRKFKPHVTVARTKNVRKKRVREWLALHGGFRAEPFQAESFSLYRSHLGHDGAYYEELCRYDYACNAKEGHSPVPGEDSEGQKPG